MESQLAFNWRQRTGAQSDLSSPPFGWKIPTLDYAFTRQTLHVRLFLVNISFKATHVQSGEDVNKKTAELLKSTLITRLRGLEVSYGAVCSFRWKLLWIHWITLMSMYSNFMNKVLLVQYRHLMTTPLMFWGTAACPETAVQPPDAGECRRILWEDISYCENAVVAQQCCPVSKCIVCC